MGRFDYCKYGPNELLPYASVTYPINSTLVIFYGFHSIVPKPAYIQRDVCYYKKQPLPPSVAARCRHLTLGIIRPIQPRLAMNGARVADNLPPNVTR